MARIAPAPTAPGDPAPAPDADDPTPLLDGIMGHRPEIAAAVDGLVRAIARHGTLPARLRELIRLRIAFHNQCRSCMAVRYRSAVAAGVTEDLVCSLERPQEADDLSEAERAALAYADLFATDHLAIDDATYDGLRAHFDEGQIVELGFHCAACVGVGRLVATWQVVDHLPEAFQDTTGAVLGPWQPGAVVV